MARKSKSKRRWQAGHAEITSAIRKFEQRGGLIRKLPDDFRAQVDAVHFEQSIGNYQGLMEWQ